MNKYVGWKEMLPGKL